MEESPNRETKGRFGQRGMSTATAAVVMVVVVLVVGGLGYFALSQSKPGSTTHTTCAPASSPACAAFQNTHDVQLVVPFKTVQTGNVVPFSAILPGGESSNNYNFSFGDGAYKQTSSSTYGYTYTSPGTYIASVQATVGGVSHDSYRSLVIISVTASYAAASSGDVPGVTGAVLANTSTTTFPTAILQPSESVTLAGSYTSAPTNPAFVPAAPSIVAPGGSISTPTSTNSTAQAQVVYSSPGIYTATFVGKAISSAGTAYQNFSWTVFVAASGFHAGTGVAAAGASSPHKGTLTIYEYAPGGSSSEDPAIDYETLGYEPILNVYQTLISYNASQTGAAPQNYVPTLATCVPGSAQCTNLYGQSLTDGTNFTFVVNPSARFYDPSTGNSWPVYPTDVLFSVARTIGFSVQPCFGCNNGWILTQALVSPGNSSWDGGIHGAANNTPQNVFAQVTVNETGFCPTAAMAAGQNGCVTFHANASGHLWPYFLELITDPLGASVVPCAFFSAAPQSAGIPGWTYGTVTGNGDHPCLLPGGATSSSDPAFKAAVAAMSPKAWDTWETQGASPPYWGNVQWTMAGSGPYYMAQLTPGTSYYLKANPAYTQNPECTWAQCEPPKGHFAGNVSVVWETSPLPGEQAYGSGSADFAGIPPTDAALLLQLVQQGKISALSFPSLSIFFFPFTMSFQASGTTRYTSNPVTIPQDFFSYVGLRQFMVHAYPYQTIQQTISTKDGIQYLFNYGGAIPQFMANYYPANVSWPSGDPSTNANQVGSAAWWWNQAAVNTSSPYYDSELAACTTSNPCQFPIFGQNGAPDVDQRMALWISEINSISGGRLHASALDINFVDLVINSLYSGPYTNPMPIYNLGWAPDYPDPTDYMVPLYKPDGSYTAADTVMEQLGGVSTFNSTSCTAYTNIAYWVGIAKSTGGVPNNCQGAAYSAMALAMEQAAVMPVGPARVLMYNNIEQIANALALYVYYGQENTVYTFANWIDGSTLNTNVTIGGGSDQTWFTIGGTNVW